MLLNTFIEQSLLTKLVIVLLLIVATSFFPDINRFFLFCLIVTNRKQGPQRHLSPPPILPLPSPGQYKQQLAVDGFGAANSMPSSNLTGATLLPLVRQHGTLLQGISRGLGGTKCQVQEKSGRIGCP
jgi:hypothetical protein